LGIEIAAVSKKGVKKFEVCDSLKNRNRSQDGVTLVNYDDSAHHEEDLQCMKDLLYTSHPPIIEKFLKAVIDNRNEYDGLGIIKGSAKRPWEEYLRLGDSSASDINDINCIECHHFLPIYMLGAKSSIELCSFRQNKNYNKIKCPGMSDIIKIKSYEQRVTALDSSGTMNSYCLDSKISGNCVFEMKKAGVVDFCPMTTTTYGFCTSSGIQVVDSLLHPKRQIVFKTQTSQTPIAVSYFQDTMLAVCRKSDVLIYDIRMDIQKESRDIAGRAKCMISNYRDRIIIGKGENKVRVLDLSHPGTDFDYDVKCINSKPNENVEKTSIEGLEMLGRIVITLNSEGTMSIFSVE
jgi:hypothetical protein